MAVERVVRHPARIEGILVTRTPRTGVLMYWAELDGAGRIIQASVEQRLNDGNALPVARQNIVRFGADSLTLEMIRGDSVSRRVVAAPRGTVPLMHPFWSYGFYDQAMRAVVGRGGDSVPMAFYIIGAPGIANAMVVRSGRDSATISWRGVGTLRFSLDPAGHMLGTNSLETTFKTEAGIEGTDDPIRLAGQFAARDAAGNGLGVLSPRDTARATVDGARIEVDYSRPARRGRLIFGNVVPLGHVWRAGADAATQLTVDKDLVVEGQRIPAGRYSVWIIPRSGGDTLLLNTQTGQWGTQHDRAQDRFRLALRRDRLVESLERYVIRITGAAGNGVLHFEWDETGFSLPFEVAR
ncbi:MAG TPA: DUF2911 domain-containing protein [Gemmatimonadales bacterium]|nr:DUF2911 domain-containing protein [Gemmatimonadales bacterium]